MNSIIANTASYYSQENLISKETRKIENLFGTFNFY